MYASSVRARRVLVLPPVRLGVPERREDDRALHRRGEEDLDRRGQRVRVAHDHVLHAQQNACTQSASHANGGSAGRLAATPWNVSACADPHDKSDGGI